MAMTSTRSSDPPAANAKPLRYVDHPSFRTSDAEKSYWPEDALQATKSPGVGHMVDEITRDISKRMHYAAFRAETAATRAAARRWRTWYYALRDEIILGNRKLVFRAVQMRLRENQHADDLIGECDIVMIGAVAAFNPWIGIRFSTYAFTCLQRALFRLNKKQCNDRLASCLSLTADPSLPSNLEADRSDDDEPTMPFEELLHEDHPLLTAREKNVLRLRYFVKSSHKVQTLEQVGQALGISKERTRQLQFSALSKLRAAFADTNSVSVS